MAEGAIFCTCLLCLDAAPMLNVPMLQHMVVNRFGLQWHRWLPGWQAVQLACVTLDGTAGVGECVDAFPLF
jgi:hypothetical protein